MEINVKPERQSTRGEPLPRWVINHLIALCEFAESRNLKTFEGMLINSTETLLKDLNSKGLPPAKPVDASGRIGANVLPFVAARYS